MQLIDKIQRQLDANHYVEAEDIQRLVNENIMMDQLIKDQRKQLDSAFEHISKLEKESPNDYTNT